MAIASKADIASVLALLEGGVVRVEKGSLDQIVEGRREDVALTVRWRATNKTSMWEVKSSRKREAWAPPLLAFVRRRTPGDASLVKSGAIAEVLTGDEDFDFHWLVEGAPRSTTKQLFGEPVRAVLREARRGTSFAIDDGVVSASMNGTRFEMSDIHHGIRCVVALRTHLGEIEEEVATAREDIAALRVKRQKVWARTVLLGRVFLVVMLLTLALSFAATFYYGCGINVLFEK